MKLRVGVAGLRRGFNLLKAFAMQPEVEIVAGCDRNPDIRQAREREGGCGRLYDSYDEFLKQDMDVVVVATPAPLHAEHSIAALECGRHVLAEVPAVYAIDECGPLVEAVRKSGRKYMLAENCCYWAFIQSWHSMVENGRLGKPIYGEAEYVHNCRELMLYPDGRPTWRATMPPIYYCTHSLGPLLMITGDRCVKVCGMSTGSNVWPDHGAIDMEVGIFTGQSGAIYKILCGFSVCREPSFHYYVLYGTKGTLERVRGEDRTVAHFADIPHAREMISLPIGLNRPRAPAGATVGGHGTCEYYMVRDFLDAIRGDTDPPIDVYRGLDFSLPGLCAHQSAEQGGAPIEIPDFR